MKAGWKFRILLPRTILGSFALACGGVLCGQTTTADDPVAATIVDTVDVELVNVEVVVTDREGRPIPGLTREDFEVVDGGQAAVISHFAALGAAHAEAADASDRGVSGEVSRPRILGVFVDNSSLPQAGRRRAFDAALEQLEALEKRGDRVTVVTWDQSLRVRREFSSPRALSKVFEEIARDAPGGNMAAGERRALLRQIGSTAMPTDGGSFATDLAASDAKAVGETVRVYLESRRRDAIAMIEAVEQFVQTLAGLEGSKTIFLLTGGMPDRPGEELIEAIENRYAAYPNLRFVHRLDAMNFDVSKRRGQLSAVANAAGVVLNGFVVDPTGNLAEDGTGELRVRDLDVQRATAAIAGLDRLARATGGLAAGEPSQADLWMRRIADERRGAYSLGWTAPMPPLAPTPPTSPTPTAAAKGRRLEIRVRRPDARARHREFVMPTTRDARSRAAVMAALMLGETVGATPIEVRLGEPRRVSTASTPTGADRTPRGGSDADWEVDLEVQFRLADIVLLPGELFHEGKVRVWLASQDSLGRRSAVSRAELPIRIANQELLTTQGRNGSWRTRLRLRALPHDIAIGLDDPLGATLATTRTRFEPPASAAAVGSVPSAQ